MKPHKNEDVMSHDARLAVLETTIGHIHEALERIDKRFDVIDKRFDAVDRKFEKMDDRIESLRKETHAGFRDLNNRLWFNFIWVVGGFIGVLTLIARLFHWV